MGLKSTLEWTKPRGPSLESFVKVLGTGKGRVCRDSTSAPAEARELPQGPFGTLCVPPRFCTGPRILLSGTKTSWSYWPGPPKRAVGLCPPCFTTTASMRAQSLGSQNTNRFCEVRL